MRLEQSAGIRHGRDHNSKCEEKATEGFEHSGLSSLTRSLPPIIGTHNLKIGIIIGKDQI